MRLDELHRRLPGTGRENGIEPPEMVGDLLLGGFEELILRHRLRALKHVHAGGIGTDQANSLVGDQTQERLGAQSAEDGALLDRELLQGPNSR